MKIINLSFLLLILSISISCDKEEPYSLATDLQNGFWEDNDDNLVLKFDGTKITFYGICTSDACDPNFPCIFDSDVQPYTLGDNTITLPDIGETLPIKIEGDVLTVDNDIIHQRKETNYPDC